MICQSCGSENTDNSVFCNKCGNKLTPNTLKQYDEILNDNGLDNNEDIETDKIESNSIIADNTSTNCKRKLQKKVLILILVIIMSISGILIFSQYRKREETKKNYELDFALTTSDILTETYKNILMCSMISETWNKAIDSHYKDFNEEIASLKEQWDSNGIIKEREDVKTKIENEMKELKNPSDDYTEAYKLMIELYGYYCQLYDQAISPTGSLLTYNQDINQKSSEFNKIYDKLKVIKPEIETKAKSQNTGQ